MFDLDAPIGGEDQGPMKAEKLSKFDEHMLLGNDLAACKLVLQRARTTRTQARNHLDTLDMIVERIGDPTAKIAENRQEMLDNIALMDEIEEKLQERIAELEAG